MKNYILFLLLIIITSCGSGGGENNSSSNNTNNPPNTDNEIQNFEPTCDSPAVSSEHEAFPFHNKGYKDGFEYYLVCNASQLASINNNDEFLSRNYRMGGDIDLFEFYEGDYVTNPTNQFMIGEYPDHPFKGVFVGDHWAISNFRLISQDPNYCGLFGYIKDATISGIQFENARIESEENDAICGSIVGLSESSMLYELAILKEEEDGVDERDWAFVRGSHVAGFIGLMVDTELKESYSVIELQNIDDELINSFSISGYTYSFDGNSSAVNLFYDGKIESVESKTEISGFSYLDINDEEGIPYISNVYYSDKIGGDPCFSNSLCGDGNISYIDTSSDQYYFMDSRNEPLSSWNPVLWWFADSIEDAHYPYLE